MRMVDIIIKKRNGEKLTKKEIEFFVHGFTEGQIPDYQASSLFMAVLFQGMDKEEISWLTDAMLHSGDTIDLSMIEGIKVDKHSTGGVGDKTTLIVGPAAAACGVPYLFSDFKKKGGYARSIVLSREYGLYRQNYCGCVYSKRAAEQREAEHEQHSGLS